MSEEIKGFADSFLAPDDMGLGSKTYSKLKNALSENEYIHMNWFPKKYFGASCNGRESR